MNLGTQTITIKRPSDGGEDEYHNPIPGAPVSTVVQGCSVQPAAGSEYVDDRSATTITYVAYVPIEADVTETDTIGYLGRDYAIDGPVQRWAVGTPLDHLVLLLKRSEG